MDSGLVRAETPAAAEARVLKIALCLLGSVASALSEGKRDEAEQAAAELHSYLALSIVSDRCA